MKNYQKLNVIVPKIDNGILTAFRVFSPYSKNLSFAQSIK